MIGRGLFFTWVQYVFLVDKDQYFNILFKVIPDNLYKPWGQETSDHIDAVSGETSAHQTIYSVF